MRKWFGRIGAVIITLLFLVSSLGLSLLVIWQNHQQDRQNQQQAQAQKAAASQNSCTIGSATGSAMTKPKAFKPDGAISKLQAVDIKPGTGASAKAGDCVQVKYLGSLAKNGSVFDENFDKPELLKFQLGKGNVIAGWDQGLVGMKVGGERRLLIPAALGYGSQKNETIPANSDLVFDVVLVKIGP